MQSTTNNGEINLNAQIEQLNLAIASNSSWVPQVAIQSSHFFQTNHDDQSFTIHPNYNRDIKHSVNLALFGNESLSSSPVLSSFRSTILHYPPNSVLEIEGFLGLDEENNVINMLKESASAGGTVLVVDSVHKPKRYVL
jgi:hypothetical protein